SAGNTRLSISRTASASDVSARRNRVSTSVVVTCVSDARRASSHPSDEVAGQGLAPAILSERRSIQAEPRRPAHPFSDLLFRDSWGQTPGSALPPGERARPAAG